MSPGKDYAPCPHCAANNITYRQVCWRCGTALPYSIGLDGRARANTDAAAHPVSRAEIERLLDQAQIIDLEGDKKRREAEGQGVVSDATVKSRLWRWLRRNTEEQSELG